MSRSKCRQILCPVRTHFLAIDGHLLAVSSHGGRDEGALWGLFDKSANPICGGSTLVNRSAPRGRSAITLGGRFQHTNLGEGRIESREVPLPLQV